MSQRSWSNALVEIEEITRQILLNGRSTAALSEPLETIGIAAFTSGMGPLLGYWAVQGQLPASAEVVAMLELHHRHNSARMRLLATRAIEATEALAARGVEATVLKGMHTAFAYFPAPGTRPVADIDLLIDPAETALAGEVLRRLGYLPGRSSPIPPQQSWLHETSSALPRSLRLTHRDDPWSIDLQIALRRRYSAGAPMIELDRLRTPQRLVSWPLSRSATGLSPAALLLHLTCHAGCGLQNLTLLRLTELILLVRKSAQAGLLSWSEVLGLADEAGCLGSAFPALYLTERLCPGVIPDEVLQTAELQAPEAVARVIRRLRPASAQSLLRCSLEERFMWTNSVPRMLRQIGVEVWPPHASLRELLWIYRMRIWRLIRGSVTHKLQMRYEAPTGEAEISSTMPR